MNIMELGAIGELVGAIAVVVTLGYLARQIRVSANSTRYLATQSMVANQAEANYLLSTHKELVELFQDAGEDRGFSSASAVDQVRMSTFMVGFYLQNDFAYHQFLNGQLEESMWRRMEKDIPVYLSVPGLAEWWSRDKSRFTPEFAAFVDRLRASFEPPARIPTRGWSEEQEHGRGT